MRITIGRALLAICVLAALAGLVWLLMPQPIPVETAIVTKGRFVATVDEDGVTQIRDRYVVAAPLGGRLIRVRLKVGDEVASGETVALIAPSPVPLLDLRSRREAEERLGAAEAARERARAVVERAQAEAQQAKTELQRTKTLAERGASTKQALERAELVLRLSDRDLRAAEFLDHATEHEINQARALLARYEDGAGAALETWTLTAPVPGSILKVDQESETIVQPGTPLVEIGDPRDLEISVDVLSTEAVEIRPGADVAIENWGGTNILAGRVRRVEPVAFTKISTLGVEEQRVNVLIDLLSPPERWAGLGDGYQIDTRITVFTAEDATIIPSGALFRRGGKWTVYVVDGNRAQEREITLLRRASGVAAVASGLAPGERVIVYPSDRVEAGVKVTAR